MTDKGPIKNETLKAWEKRAKEVYKESLKIMKEGIHGLEVMAEKTLEATRLKISNQKAAHRMKEHFISLGRQIYESTGGKKVSQVSLTPEMQTHIQEIEEIQKKIQTNLEILHHLSAVGGNNGAAQAKASDSQEKPAPKKSQKNRPKKS